MDSEKRSKLPGMRSGLFYFLSHRSALYIQLLFDYSFSIQSRICDAKSGIKGLHRISIVEVSNTTTAPLRSAAGQQIIFYNIVNIAYQWDVVPVAPEVEKCWAVRVMAVVAAVAVTV